MKYTQEITLKNGSTAILRNGTIADADAALALFNQTHGETDYLLSYPDECKMRPKEEGQFLEEKTNSDHEAELLAVVDGKIVGSAGIERIGRSYKNRHRAEFGIAVLKDYWGLGIGKALMDACIRCAQNTGYTQLELTVVADNQRAVALYQKAGFQEYGRNPRGFQSRTGGYQETVSMRLEL